MRIRRLVGMLYRHDRNQIQDVWDDMNRPNNPYQIPSIHLIHDVIILEEIMHENLEKGKSM